MAAKQTLRSHPDGGLSVTTATWKLLAIQLSSVRAWRLPFAAIRLALLASAYRSCLRDFALVTEPDESLSTAVLTRRPGIDSRRKTAACGLRVPSL